MRLLLDVSTSQPATLHGTVRRASDDVIVAFHGVLELVAVIDRLLAGDESARTASSG